VFIIAFRFSARSFSMKMTPPTAAALLLAALMATAVASANVGTFTYGCTFGCNKVGEENSCTQSAISPTTCTPLGDETSFANITCERGLCLATQNYGATDSSCSGSVVSTGVLRCNLCKMDAATSQYYMYQCNVGGSSPSVRYVSQCSDDACTACGKTEVFVIGTCAAPATATAGTGSIAMNSIYECNVGSIRSYSSDISCETADLPDSSATFVQGQCFEFQGLLVNATCGAYVPAPSAAPVPVIATPAPAPALNAMVTQLSYSGSETCSGLATTSLALADTCTTFTNTKGDGPAALPTSMTGYSYTTKCMADLSSTVVGEAYSDSGCTALLSRFAAAAGVCARSYDTGKYDLVTMDNGNTLWRNCSKGCAPASCASNQTFTTGACVKDAVMPFFIKVVSVKDTPQVMTSLFAGPSCDGEVLSSVAAGQGECNEATKMTCGDLPWNAPAPTETPVPAAAIAVATCDAHCDNCSPLMDTNGPCIAGAPGTMLSASCPNGEALSTCVTVQEYGDSRCTTLSSTASYQCGFCEQVAPGKYAIVECAGKAVTKRTGCNAGCSACTAISTLDEGRCNTALGNVVLVGKPAPCTTVSIATYNETVCLTANKVGAASIVNGKCYG
jgi:hypothetical protein